MVVHNSNSIAMVLPAMSILSQKSFLSTKVTPTNSLDPDQARHYGLPLVQTVCKSYPRTTIVGKELISRLKCLRTRAFFTLRTWI